jgi:hypothetical protein
LAEHSASLPAVQEVRKRISDIPNLGLLRYYQFLYLTGSRCGEGIGLKYPSDPAQQTGQFLSAKEDVYQVDMMNFEDVMTIQAIKLMDEGRQIDLMEISKIREPVAIFKITTEKRAFFERYTALPLNPIYDQDGWVRKVFDYVVSRQGKEEPVFPYYRQQVYPVARALFDGWKYPIVSYVTGKDGPVIRAHQKAFANHAIRHLRATELKSKYRIKGEMLDSFMGWTKARGAGSSPMQDKYVLEPWKEAGYFPRLLRRFS